MYMVIVESETKIIIPQKMLHKIGNCRKLPAKAEMEIRVCKKVSELHAASNIIGYYF